MPDIYRDPEFMDLLPNMTTEEYEALKQSLIENEGAINTILLWHDPESNQDIIIDGLYRYEICMENHLKCRYEWREFPDREAAKRWRVRLELEKRHLNPFQRIELAETQRDLLTAEAKERQGTRTDLHGEKDNSTKLRESSKPRSSTKKPALSEPSEPFEPNTPQDVEMAYRQENQDEQTFTLEEDAQTKRKRSRENETIVKVSKMACVGETTYRHALEIKKSGNDILLHQLRKGEITINGAYNIIKEKAKKKELDKHTRTMAKALNQIQEEYNWFLGQEYERCGENVTINICAELTNAMREMQKMFNRVTGLTMTSDAGIISVVTDEADTDEANAVETDTDTEDDTEDGSVTDDESSSVQNSKVTAKVTDFMTAKMNRQLVLHKDGTSN